MDETALEEFILEGKAACYVGDGARAASSRLGSHDLGHASGRWRYLDSYFGGTNFSGQEVVWYDGEPVWSMNYFGAVVRPALIDATRAGAVIKAALSHLYREERRVLGGHAFDHAYGRFVDVTEGNFTRFSGRETISVAGQEAYVLHYHGGRIIP